MGFIKFGGDAQGTGAVDLNSGHYLVENVVRPIAPIENNSVTPSGGDGMLFFESALRCPTIEMTIWVMGTSAQRREKTRALAKLLSTKEPTRLEFADDGGKYYMVVPVGDRAPVDYIDSTCFDVKFESLHPYMFGETRTYTVGTTLVRLENKGSYEPLIRFQGQSVTADGDGKWGLNSNWGLMLSYTLPQASATYQVNEINVDTRYSYISKSGTQAVFVPGITSKWGSMLGRIAGSIRVSSGGGSVTMSVTDRYV